MYNNAELYHHGVKGMKWGIRRKRSSSETSGSSNPHAVISTSSSSSSGGHSTKKNTTSTVKVTKQTKTKGTSVKQYSTEKPKTR